MGRRNKPTGCKEEDMDHEHQCGARELRVLRMLKSEEVMKTLREEEL